MNITHNYIQRNETKTKVQYIARFLWSYKMLSLSSLDLGFMFLVWPLFWVHTKHKQRPHTTPHHTTMPSLVSIIVVLYNILLHAYPHSTKFLHTIHNMKKKHHVGFKDANLERTPSIRTRNAMPFQKGLWIGALICMP